ncbi:MAG: hypothetical protein ACKV2U_17060 [Bryobacteraceae bacterium]
MKLFKSAATAGCMAVLGAAFLPVANADAWDKKSVITFSSPVSIPGVHRTGFGVLPAGTYVFKILSSQGNRHVVQIFNKEETTVYATILAIPNFRMKATDKTVVTFSERPAGEPEALRAWFYPGRNWGEEFVYPKAKAMELAKSSNMPVLFTTTEFPDEVAEPSTAADGPLVAELNKAPLMAYSAAGQEVQLADAVTPPPAEEDQAAAAAQTPVAEERTVAATLPATASQLPIITLFGFMALAGAAALRSIEKRIR